MATTAKSATTAKNANWSADEKAAMKERAKELKAEQSAKESLADLQAKIAAMPPADRHIAERIHAVVTEVAPQLTPKTWYGMPAYATAEGKLVCFFKAADKFDSRYATFGFEEAAKVDDGDMWPTSYALLTITPAIEKTIGDLVKKAVS